jgi:hypothetical protein
MQFSNIQLKRGSRFVQSDDVLFTAGGLTSGIDLTLHIVEKFYGQEAADRTAAAYTIVRPRECIADTQPQLQPALLRLSEIDRAAEPNDESVFRISSFVIPSCWSFVLRHSLFRDRAAISCAIIRRHNRRACHPLE